MQDMLVRWNPTTELSNLHNAMDRLFSDFFSPTFGGTSTAGGYVPLDVIEETERYRIRAPLPGFKPEQVDVTLADSVLTISAEARQEETRKEASYLRQERHVGNVYRQIALPADVKSEGVEANFEDGVLTIEVPREPKAKPIKIEISKGSKQLVGTAKS